jgi:6-phosphogluconolactonase (cycloisomerase 2 family)
MKPILKLAMVVASGAAVAALPALPASAAPLHPASHAAPVRTRHWTPQHTVFAATDATGGNTIVAYVRTATGGLQQVGSYPTGGNGGILTGSAVDHLASEGSLAYDRQAGLLYAVNAGSNTISVFAVHGDRLALRQVIRSGGQFPVSIAVHGSLVYVLNALGGGSVSGYVQAGGFLVAVPSWHRDLGLNPDQTPQFTSTPGQVSFTPDGSQLVVTTKNGANTIDVFRVGPFGLSAAPTVTSLPGTVPFGFTFDGHGHLVVTEAGPSAVATFSIASDGTLTQLDAIATGKAAACWITTADGTLYASDAGSATESVLRADASGTLTLLPGAATDAGTVDATASGDGRYLYVQAGKSGNIDAFRIGPDGSLTETGSVTVPDAAGGEGIAAS